MPTLPPELLPSFANIPPNRRQMDTGYRQQTPGYPEYAHRAMEDLWPTPLDFAAQFTDAGALAQMWEGRESLSPEQFGILAAGMLLPDAGMAALRKTGVLESDDPIKAYRALRMYPSRPGEVFPAMIKAKEGVKNMPSIPMGEWLRSGFDPDDARRARLSPRIGWHAGVLPYARQFDKTKGPYKGQQPDDMVWTEVDMLRGKDYQPLIEEWGSPPKYWKGPQEEVPFYLHPVGGSYEYYPNNAAKRAGNPWIISDAVKHNRLMTDEEVDDMVRAAGLEPIPRQGGPWTEKRLREGGFK